MNKRSTAPTQTNDLFQRIEESYMVPTYMVSNYLGETGPLPKKGPTKADFEKLMAQYRANKAEYEDMDDKGTKGEVKSVNMLLYSL